jgi:Domain of unknown function (DUF4174)
MSFRFQDSRVFIVFADGPDPRVEALLALGAGLADRNMIVFAVIGDDTIVPIYGKAPPAAAAGALRAQYRAQTGSSFTAVLIGKDGTVKWREDRPADPGELFGLIDTMPMRQQEVVQRKPSR